MVKLLTRQEELVLLTLCSFKDGTNLKEIRKRMIAQTNKEWSISSVYVPLDRLTENGFVSAFFGEKTSMRGGKANRFFKVTELGIKTLQEVRALTNSMWDSIGNIAIQDESR